MEAKRTPLIELLERVPRDAVLVVEHDQFSSSSHPVGRLCHEAAAALEATQMGLRYAVRVWVLSDEIEWGEAEIDEVVESIISDAKKEASND